MGYLPKSTANFRQARYGEFKVKRSGTIYNGPVIETSTGRYYAGNDPSNLKIELSLATEKTPLNFGFNRDAALFNKYNKNSETLHKKYTTPIASKPQPTEDDYTKGYYTRYYMVRINDNEQIFEINKKTYLSHLNNEGTFDEKLYNVGSIDWALKSNDRSVLEINFVTLEDESQFAPNISIAFPILNEFERVPKHKAGQENEYNIEGRYYPDDDIDPIPSNLPPTYKIGKENKKCTNCVHFQNNNCTLWKAIVRPAYWCKSFYIKEEAVDASFEAFMEEQRLKREEELRMKREGKLLDSIGRAIAEALKARGLEEGEDFISEQKPNRENGPRDGNEKQPPRIGGFLNKIKEKKRKKERKNIGGFRKGNNNNPEYRTVYFNPKDVFTLMKRKKGKRETGEGLVGNSIGEKVINTFNKKIYKWNGRTWLLAKFQN